MGPIGIACLAAVVIFLAVLIIRALAFKPKNAPELKSPELPEADENAPVVGDLCAMIRCKTVSNLDKAKIDQAEFDKLKNEILKRFPTVFAKAESALPGTENGFRPEGGFFLKLKGAEEGDPTVLMAHCDVVPATGDWDFDPFCGEIRDGFILGRGSMDTKQTLVSCLRATEEALKQGYQPKRDVYLCFGWNEEVFGDSHFDFIDLLKAQGIRPALVFDEGGAVVNAGFPGVKDPAAVIGVVEKAMFDVKLSLDGNGGHSSSPKKNGPVVQLAKAIERLDKHPMKPQFCATTEEMIDTLGRRSTFGYKLIFANMWLFRGLLKKVFSILSADTRALVSTTFAFTVISGGSVTNVIPNHVEANVNVRQAPFNTKEEIVEYIRKTIKNPAIEIQVLNESVIYSECSTKSWGYRVIKETAETVFPEAVVAPFLNIGGSDARHYNQVSDAVMRFSPMVASNEDRKGIHGTNEKIAVSNLLRTYEFYCRLLEKL